MHDYKEVILKELVKKYRNSKKDRGENKVNRSIKVLPHKLYPQYNSNHGDLQEIIALNEAITQCGELGFLTYKKAKFSYEISDIVLVDEMIETIEDYLRQNYNFISKQDKMNVIFELLDKYEGCSTAADVVCQNIRKNVEQRKVPKNYLELEDVLKALVFVENNHEDLFLREASMLIYGSSKYFEENTLHEVCMILRNHREMPCSENEMEDEILTIYNIKKEAQRICIKGNCTIHTTKGTIDVALLQDGIEFSSGEMDIIQHVIVHQDRFLTIENKTAYHRYPATNEVVFYLGGYMTRYQRDFLYLVKSDNLHLQYDHFGDIDAGGFLIFEQLCKYTNIAFHPYCMGIDQLEDVRFANCLQTLSENDLTKLQNIQKKGLFLEIITYMIEHNVKLEQEIICYRLKCNGNNVTL